jgi:hypothetical protein
VQDDDCYYAPTCGFVTYECVCGNVIDLLEYTGLSLEDASNAAEIEAEIERCARAAVSGFQRTVEMLLAVLPDSIRDDDPTWEYCWNELSGDAQEQVKDARREALRFLGRPEPEASCPDCGEPWPETETIRADGSLGCPCQG